MRNANFSSLFAQVRARWSALDAEVSVASLALFRVAFGLLMSVAMVRFWAKGYFEAQLLSPRFHFSYELLPTLFRPPDAALEGMLVIAVCAALMVALGLFYRVAIVVFGIVFVYFELLERSTYLNHYYLISLLCLLLSFMPAHHAFSWDARRALSKGRPLFVRMPAWMVYAVRAQLAVVYVFAGIAKLNADWLWRAQPLRIWLSSQADLLWVGASLGSPWSAFALSWLGALFDLGIVPLLLWRRTRVLAYASLCVFHGVTGLLLPIGIFPWLMILSATLFFSPSWPNRWLPERTLDMHAIGTSARWLRAAFTLHILVQLALPLYLQVRHVDAAWTGQGFNFAWKVMLAERAGDVRFRVRERSSEREYTLSPRRYLTPSQAHAMAQDPQLIRHFARHVAHAEARRGRQVAVYADALLSLNGRPSRRVIDPKVDLAGAQEHFVLPMPED